MKYEMDARDWAVAAMVVVTGLGAGALVGFVLGEFVKGVLALARILL